jgi:hypothetical protein
MSETPTRKKTFMIFVEGQERSFHCDTKLDDGSICGINVFTKPFLHKPGTYLCNGCGARYTEVP